MLAVSSLHNAARAGWKDGREDERKGEEEAGSTYLPSIYRVPELCARHLPHGEHSQTHAWLVHAFTGSSIY